MITTAVNFGGDVLVGNGALIEIGGHETGEFDSLNTSGEINVSGGLDVSFIDGFTASAGATFEIISATNITGTFNTFNLPALPGGLQWFVSQDSSSVVLSTTFVADFNSDGIVDAADYTIWLDNLGNTSATHAEGDADGNGFVDELDYLSWKSSFGDGVFGNASSQNIPEPTAFALASFAMLCFASSRRR